MLLSIDWWLCWLKGPERASCREEPTEGGTRHQKSYWPFFLTFIFVFFLGGEVLLFMSSPLTRLLLLVRLKRTTRIDVVLISVFFGFIFSSLYFLFYKKIQKYKEMLIVFLYQSRLTWQIHRPAVMVVTWGFNKKNQVNMKIIKREITRPGRSEKRLRPTDRDRLVVDDGTTQDLAVKTDWFIRLILVDRLFSLLAGNDRPATIINADMDDRLKTKVNDASYGLNR